MPRQMLLFEGGCEQALEARKKNCRLGHSRKTNTPICKKLNQNMAQNSPVSSGAYQQLIFADFASEFNHSSAREGV